MAASTVDAHEKYFLEVQEALAARDDDADVLISVPIWGWTGHGKTCALLTAIQFCDSEMHGLSLALIEDSHELVELTRNEPAYAQLGLVAAAEDTRTRLESLNRQFFTKNEWPEGTDDPSLYLLELRMEVGKLGYVLFPDLRGGSYEDLDDAARHVTSEGHALCVIVDPIEYSTKSVEGKRYRDAVKGRIQRCAQHKTPAAILITKSDRSVDEHAEADETHRKLSVFISRLGEYSEQARVFRVSVKGQPASASGEDNDSVGDADALPPLSDRQPDELVLAWVWVLHQALKASNDDLRKKVPSLNVTRNYNPSFSAKEKSELRLEREMSDGIGRVVGSRGGVDEESFLFVDEDGEVVESGLNLDDGSVDVTDLGKVDLSEFEDSLVGFASSGGLILGPQTAAMKVWRGTTSADSEILPLAIGLDGWLAIGVSTLVGVDDKGTLHTFELKGKKWAHLDYLASFLTPSEGIWCGYHQREGIFIATNGTTSAGAKISSAGKLGGQVSVNVVEFDSGPCRINSQGTSVAISEGQLWAHPDTNLGEAKDDLVAIASAAPMIAWVTPTLKLKAALVRENGVIETEISPTLEEEPDALVWSESGRTLVLTYPSGRWGWYRTYGMGL